MSSEKITISDEDNAEIICNELASELYSPIEYLNKYTSDHIFYFKNKAQDFEICAFGKKETGLSLDKLKSLSLTNENLYLISLSPFYSQITKENTQKNEWDNLNIQSYLPKLVIVRIKNLTKVYSYEDSDINILKERKINEFNLDSSTEIEIPKYKQWESGIINSKESMKKKNIDKIVLSRKIIIQNNIYIDAQEYFLNKSREVQNSYHIYLKQNDQHFLCFSPETLLRSNKDELMIDCIAGTIKKSKEEDKAREHKSFLSDKKEINEHRFVCKSIEEVLKELGMDYKYEFKEEILSLKYVEHIHSLITSKSDKTKILELIKNLHPTPAVGGRPKEEALKLILEIEGQKRGLYASPIGILSKNLTEIAVGIRSALIHDKEMYLYGGCGIVKESIPEKEWNETQEKMKNFI